MLPANHDAAIYQNNPDYGSGGGNALLAGTNGSLFVRRGLLAFDIAGSVPAGATIQSAELTLCLAQYAGSGGGAVALLALHGQRRSFTQPMAA